MLKPNFNITFDRNFVPPADKPGLYYYIDTNHADLHAMETNARQTLSAVLDSPILVAGFKTNRTIERNKLDLKASSAAERDKISANGVNYVGKVSGASVVWGNKLSNGLPLIPSRVLATALHHAISFEGLHGTRSNLVPSIVRNRFLQKIGELERYTSAALNVKFEEKGHSLSLLISPEYLGMDPDPEGIPKITFSFDADVINISFTENMEYLFRVFDFVKV